MTEGVYTGISRIFPGCTRSQAQNLHDEAVEILYENLTGEPLLGLDTWQDRNLGRPAIISREMILAFIREYDSPQGGNVGAGKAAKIIKAAGGSKMSKKKSEELAAKAVKAGASDKASQKDMAYAMARDANGGKPPPTAMVNKFREKISQASKDQNPRFQEGSVRGGGGGTKSGGKSSKSGGTKSGGKSSKSGGTKSGGKKATGTKSGGKKSTTKKTTTKKTTPKKSTTKKTTAKKTTAKKTTAKKTTAKKTTAKKTTAKKTTAKKTTPKKSTRKKTTAKKTTPKKSNKKKKGRR